MNLALPIDPGERYLMLRDPKIFLRTCVYTEDNVDLNHPIKPAPNRDYLYSLVDLWQRESILAILKSRRMWITWLFMALFLHDAITNNNRAIYYVSKKEEDADALVRKSRFILENIPEAIWPPEFLPRMHYKQNHLLFPDIGSSLNAVASGPDQLRMHTASGIFMDEFGFWEKCKETYTSAKPTIEGGGRVTIVSTPPPQTMAEPSFFYRLVYDQMEEE